MMVFIFLIFICFLKLILLESQTYWFNHKSQDLIQYELLGCVIGLAIYNGIILDLKFPSLVYKKLLHRNSYDLEDLKDVSPVCNMKYFFAKLNINIF